MADDNMNLIPTGLLFRRVNVKRQKCNEPPIEDALLASKLGILVAVKTDKYANFKGEIVALTGRQLIALETILDEYFNAHMHGEVHKLVLPPSQGAAGASTQAGNDEAEPKQGLLGKLTGFFRRRKK
ncbi:MAG: hypothetical protein GY862_10755 [Gammaproteobacteria bacterium]|nr:hypothetical protein [Gammaproteobacteria bacterium]